MDDLNEFYGPNAGYVLELYERYQRDPESVDPHTRSLFQGWTPPPLIAPAEGVSAGRNGEAGESFLCVFIGKLRDDSFAARKMKFLAADMNCLFRFADQMHLNAAMALVVNRQMSPEREIEVRAELTVRANEQI